jgi:hypothetical protein
MGCVVQFNLPHALIDMVVQEKEQPMESVAYR